MILVITGGFDLAFYEINKVSKQNNITYRITIDFIIRDKEIVPINIGKHDKECRKM